MDSGADVSVIPQYMFGKITKTPINKLSAANGSTIDTFGTKMLKVSLGLRREFQHEFVLASVNRPLIGADFLAKFGILLDLKNKKLIDPLTSLFSKGSIASVDTPTPKLFQVDGKFKTILDKFPSLTAPPDYSKPVQHSVVQLSEGG